MKNICDWNNCKKIGEYKAPMEKDNSKEYRMLCLEHIKEFNKFKVLVKKFHPDMNSGDRKYEEKLKLITLAYTQLKNTYREKIDT